MADVITRFKLETTQYDSKLRDASKSLAEYTRKATQAGNEFGKFTQKNVEAARALGNITPSATNAKDKVKELVGAFNDAARAYNALTKEQQQSDFGRAMAESIGQLSQQLKEAKQEFYGMGDAMKKAGGGLFGGIGDKMSGALQVFAGNMLTKAAGAVANLGSEMMETARQSVDLAQKGEGVRIAFERLNNPGLLANLKEATHGTVSELELMKAAVKFDDFKLPVEELGTMLAFAQKKASDTGQSVDYMVDSIVTGLGRKSLMILDNLGLSASQVKDRMAETGDMTKAVADIIREEMEKSGGYVETAATRAARATAQAQDKMMELGRTAMPVAEAYNEAWGEIRLGAMSLMTTVLVPIANFLKQLRAESNMTAEDILTNGMTDVTDTVDDNGKLINKNAINNIPEIVVIGNTPKKAIRPRGGGKTEVVYAEGSIAAQQKLVQDLTKQWNEAGEEMKRGYLYQLVEAEQKLKSMKESDAFNKKGIELLYSMKNGEGASPVGLGESSFSGKSLKDLQGVKLELKLPKEKTEASFTKEVGNMAGGISQMVGSMEALGIELPKGMKNVVGGVTSLISIVSGISTIVMAIEALTAADTIIPFARGGVVHAANGFVQGNNYSGDMIPAALNAGELVLNKAQQGNLASQLQGAGFGGVNMVGEISGESIKIVLNRHLKRTGQGEIVTW